MSRRNEDGVNGAKTANERKERRVQGRVDQLVEGGHSGRDQKLESRSDIAAVARLEGTGMDSRSLASVRGKRTERNRDGWCAGEHYNRPAIARGPVQRAVSLGLD